MTSEEAEEEQRQYEAYLEASRRRKYERDGEEGGDGQEESESQVYSISMLLMSLRVLCCEMSKL